MKIILRSANLKYIGKLKTPVMLQNCFIRITHLIIIVNFSLCFINLEHKDLEVFGYFAYTCISTKIYFLTCAFQLRPEDYSK